MGPKKGRRVRKIKVPTDRVPQLGRHWGTLWQIFTRGVRRGRQEIGRNKPRDRGKMGSGGRRTQEWRKHTHKRRELEKKRSRTEKTDTESKAVTSLQSHYKKGDMINIYRTDSDEEAIFDFDKDKDKARMECIRERFPNSLSRCVRPGLSCRGQKTASSGSQSWTQPGKNVRLRYRTSLDS